MGFLSYCLQIKKEISRIRSSSDTTISNFFIKFFIKIFLFKIIIFFFKKSGYVTSELNLKHSVQEQSNRMATKSSVRQC